MANESNHPRGRRLRLGDLLIEAKVITQAQFDQAIVEQKNSGKRLGKVLVDQGVITEEDLHQFLARQLKVPYLDLRQTQLEAEHAQKIPESMARRHRAVVVREEGEAIVLGMTDPTNLFGYDEIAAHLKRPIRLVLVAETPLLAALDVLYRRTDEMAEFAQEVRDDLRVGQPDADALRVDEGSPDAPVLKLLNSIFEDAVQMRASDIHIEPAERGLRIRQRVDGVLHEHLIDGNRVSAALVSRLKLMAGIDIAERRLPQDGRFSLLVRGRTVDVRVSTLPLQTGESAVLRLLDQSASILPLDQLGMDDGMRQRFAGIVERSAGMLLVTGPTGSGKTTTLYSALNHLNSPENKIITVEDPVEYRLDRVCQVQINARIGLDFGRALRTILRQDPDVVLVGEMRDRETVDIGLRAAITGHMVLSTLHTSTAVGAVSRLLDMGAEGFMIAAAVHGVLAQRLVRRVCPDCAEPQAPDEHERVWLRSQLSAEQLANARFAIGRGCNFCNGSGYRGRLAVHELLEFDLALTEAVRRADLQAVDEAAHAQVGYRPLVSRALELAMLGQTSVAEVIHQLSGLEDTRQRVAQSSAEPTRDLQADEVRQVLGA
jgi:MSHA biogenesis protein MshE